MTKRLIGGIVKISLGIVLKTTTTSLVLPFINAIISNQINLKIGHGDGSKPVEISSKVRHPPLLNAHDGINFAIEMVAR